MKFALLIFYAAGTLAAPVLDDRYPKAEVKDIECKGSRFRAGTTFEYAYGGETINNVEGTSKQSTGLQLSARVFITQLRGCDYHMRLGDTKLSAKGMMDEAFAESPESSDFQKSLEKNDLIFTMKGNTISAIRARDSESTEALNIKRGILSTLQLDEDNTSETDVNGLCQYTVTKKDGVIVKTKTLSECNDRTLNEIGIQSSSIKTGSDLKPLNSKSTCTYQMDAGTIRSAVCEESHMFRPFSAGYKTPSGAMTMVTQETKFVGYLESANKDVDANSYNVKKTLAFDHTVEENKQVESLTGQVETVIKRLIDQSSKSATKTSAQEFTTLVTMFRKMNKNKMQTIWNRYFDCTASRVCGETDLNMKDLYRQYMLDAIAYCGTPSCIAVVKDVTISGEIAGERANMFLQSIALVAKTTNSMIRDILDIAKNKPSRQVFLTLGTLISRHCTKSPEECNVQSGNAVVQAENFLERTLGDCQGQDDHERVEEILMTLKAIGNAKRPTNARSALIRCAQYSSHSNITMSAFDAVRGMPCDTATLTELRQVISNENIAADKRIYAFQAAMKCPTKQNLELLVHLYNMEKNNQVASFMWTFLTNIMESSNPDNKEAREILTTINKETPLKETNLPMYQYSKNFEKSLYLDSLKTGASAQANLVFHPDGFLPKTAMFDMTAKIMGVPVDVVETVVGIDGIESVLENAFGPGGVLPKDFSIKMLNWDFSTEKLKEMVEKRVRREVRPNDAESVMNDIHDTVNKKPTQPSGFMSLKVMGQEVRMMSYDDIYAMIEQIDNMNVIQLLLNWAKGGEKTFSKSMMFLEMTHCVPTGLGLPLKLKLTGSTVGTVDISGKFDIRSLFWGPAGVNINGFVKPTAVVDISGKMGIESDFVSTGLLVSNNMMVSNMLKGSILYKESEVLQINLDTPTEPVQLFHASSTPYMYMNERNDMIEGVPRMIKFDKCLKSQIIGYGLCTSVRAPIAFRNYEAPYFPLSGPAHVGLSFVRGDEKLTTFQFKTQMTKVTNGVEGVVEFSTPGAVYERRMAAKMLYTDANNDKELTLSAERIGSVKFAYNGISHTTSVETKANILKGVTTRLVYFNQTSLNSQQFGVQMMAEYGDVYKFQHVVKYVRSEAEHAIESMTEYAPKKVITAALRFNTAESKLKASFDMNEIRQSVEVIGKLENTATTKGATLRLVHVPTGKSAQLYAAYVSAEGKKEIVTSVTVDGKPIKNVLGWYKDGNKTNIRNFFLFKQQSATLDASYEDRDGMKEMQLNADLFGKRAMANMIFTGQRDQRLVRFIVDAAGKRVITNAVLTNMDVEKSMKITVDTAGKKAEASVGYYNMRDVTIFKVEGEVLGKRAEMFWKLKNTGGYQSTVGVVINKYQTGVRASYVNNDAARKEVCGSVYYGTTTEAEKTAVEGCMKYNVLDNEGGMHRQMECSLNSPVMNKKVTLLKDLIVQKGRVNAAIRTIYNGKVLATQKMNVAYGDLRNAEVAFDVIVGKMVDAGVKLYTQTTKTAGATNAGLLFRVNGKTLELLNRYREVRAEGELKGRVTSSVVVNGRELTVTTDVEFLHRNGELITSAAINAGDYTVKQSSGILYGNGKYGVGLATEVLFGGQRLTKVFIDYVASVSETKWAFDNMFGFSLKARDFKYGWHVEYENRSFGMKRTHVLTANLQYATGRMSTVTLMFADSAKLAAAELDIEYIPSRIVKHFVRYDKEKRQVDFSFEFLPKMFTKFSARLDNNLGYELITSTNVEWQNFKRVLKTIYSYVNNEKEFAVSTSIAGDITFGLKFNKMEPKSLTFTVDFFSHRAQLVATYQNMQARLDLIVNGKSIVKLEGSYDQVAQTFRMFAVRGEKILFDMTSGYNKVMDAFNMALTGARNWAGVNINTKGHRTVVSLMFMKKGFAKVILNKKDYSLALQLKSTVSFLLKYLPKSSSLSFTVKTKTARIALIGSADWNTKMASFHVMFNKERFGVKVFLAKNALNIRLTASPLMTAKIILAYTGDGVSVVVQRITDGKVIKEASFKWALNKDTCELLFNWNTDTIKKVKELVQPLIAAAFKNSKEMMRTVWENSDKLIAMSKEAKVEILNFINNMEKAFDEYDFVAARDAVGTATLKALRKLSDVTVKALTKLATALDTVKDRVPEVVEKLRVLIKDIKTYVKSYNGKFDVKAKEIIAKAEEMIKRGREMIKEGRQMMTTMTAGLDKNVKEVIDVVTKITANLTDATRPVVAKAIVLLKDFKIRGKRLEDLVIMAKTEGKKYMDMYVEKATAKFEELKVQADEKLAELKAQIITAADKATETLKKMKIPYTDKTVTEVIELIQAKIAELKEKMKTMDVNALAEELKAKVMDLKIKGKTVTQYFDELKAKTTELRTLMMTLATKYKGTLKEMPEATRQALQDLIANARNYVKDMDVYVAGMTQYVDEVIAFAKPLTDHMLLVQASVTKHFGPLVKEVVAQITDTVSKLELPTLPNIKPIIAAQMKRVTDFFLPLLRPIVPLYRNLLEQVRGLSVGGFRLGTAVDMQAAVMDEQLREMVADARTKMNAQMEILNNMVEEMKKKTPEQVIDNSIDASVKICKDLVAYLNSLYEKRETLAAKAKVEVANVYEKMKAQYAKISSKSIDDVTEQVITGSSSGVIVTATELSNLIKQVVAMDISTPTWNAWVQADLLGHLERYGVNEKINSAIAFAKKANMTTTIFETIATIQNYIDISVQRSSVTALELFRKLEIVFKYLKSIPKKDYDTWLNEMTQFTLSNKAAVEKLLKTLYETSRTKALEAYETLQRIAREDGKRLYEQYVAKAQGYYNTVAEKAQLVYADVKQPTIDVYNHYKSTILDFVTKQYLAIKKLLTTEYEKIYTDLKAKIGELKVKVEAKIEEVIAKMKLQLANVRGTVEKTYEEFLAKYGDLTWDDVASKIEAFTRTQLEAAKTEIVAQYEKILTQAKELKGTVEAKALEVYNKAVVEYERVVEKITAKIEELKMKVMTKYEEIKPKVIEAYKKYETQVVEAYKKYEAMIKVETDKLMAKAKDMYAEVKAKATEIYNQNKDKTLKQIVTEIRKFIVENYLKQKEYLKSLADKNYEKANQLLDEAKSSTMAMYQKIGLKLKSVETVVIPEVLAEIESLINQTLRNSVIMTKEIIKAYTPHAVLVKDVAKKYMDIIKEQAPLLIAQAKGLMRMDMEQVKGLLKIYLNQAQMKIQEVIATIKKDERYVKYVAVLEAKITQLKQIIEEKIAELKTNPTLIKLRTDIEKRIVQIKTEIQMNINKVMADPKFIETRQKIEESIKVLRVRVDEYQKKLDVIVQKAIDLLKQIAKSGKFTVEKLQMNLQPRIDEATMTLKGVALAVPEAITRGTQYFMDVPEDAFWYAIEVYREAVVGAYQYAKLLKKEDVVREMTTVYTDAVALSKELYQTSTDEWTKENVNKLVTEMTTLYNKLTVQYESLVAQGKGLPALLMAYYEKTLVDLKKNIAMAREWTANEIADLKKFWESSTLKGIVDNQIWGELAEEISNHELVGVAKEIADIAVVKINELTEQFKVQVLPMLEAKYATLKAAVEKNTLKMRTETLALYNKVTAQLTWILENAEKIYSETTIAEMVAFVEKQYKLMLVKIDELKVKLSQWKGEFITKAKEFYAKCETKVRALVAEYKTKVMALVEEYKTILMPYYQKAMNMYTKYSEELMAKYKELMVKYTEIMEKVIAKYDEIKEQAIAKYTEVKDLITKYKTQAVEELKKARESVIKMWEESEILAKINAFRRMTVRQTIEALRELPSVVYKDLVAKYEKVSADLVALYNKICADLKTRYNVVLAKATAQLEKIMEALRPYITEVNGAYNWIENEITATGLFVFRYYALEDKYNQVKAMITAEIKRIMAVVKKNIPLLRENLKKYVDLYKTMLTQTAAQKATMYKELVQVYARQAQDIARTMPDKTLRGIHAGLVRLDNFDTSRITAVANDLIKKVGDVVTIVNNDGEFGIRIAHPDIKPTVMYYTNLIKTNAKQTLKGLNIQVKQMLKNIKDELENIKGKADKLRMQIQEAVMRNTAEMRRDFNISLKINKNIAIRVYNVVKAVVMRNYQVAKAQYDILEAKALQSVAQVRQITAMYYQQLTVTAQKVYAKVETIARDLADAQSPKELYQRAALHAVRYYEILKKQGETLVATYRPMVEEQLKTLKAELTAYYKTLEGVYKQLKDGYPYRKMLATYWKKAKEMSVTLINKADKTAAKMTKVVLDATEAYYALLKDAYEQVRSGTPLSEVVKPLTDKLMAIYRRLRYYVERSDLRTRLCKDNTELCKLVEESVAVHKVILKKYADKLRAVISVGKAHVDRTVRKINKQVKQRNIKEKYTATAMVMGDHILTFDGKLYNFVDMVKAKNGGNNPCRYLLARDFQDKKFTLMKSDGAITVETPDMSIKIREDGRTKTTIGNEMTNSLPVESGDSQCIRIDNLILCHFKEQMMKVTVDLKNFFTVISVSGWYKGKTRGLLGTHNNEAHDDWRLPNNKISKNINEFLNAYELTGNKKCELDLKTEHVKTCEKKVSKKCLKYFVSDDSPFSTFFGTVDPAPFNELCLQDSKCNKRAPVKAHCSAVAAYVTMLRTNGVWVSHPAECMGDRGRDVNEEWVRKPMKSVIDVVVMVSQKRNMLKMKKRIAQTLYQLHRTLKGDNFQVRYALVGFGGKGVHEPAHSHPLRRGPSVFGYILDLNKEIKTMPYNGVEAGTNDGYHAILTASKLKFRPGAEKIFIMFNSEPHLSHGSGPSFDETQYLLANEANAPLIVFDTINFPNLGKEAGRIIGQTERRLYTTNNLQGQAGALDLPANEFKQLVLLSKGGLFSNMAFKKPKQAAISLHDVVVNWIKKDIEVCKRCTLRNSWTGQSRPICVSDPKARC